MRRLQVKCRDELLLEGCIYSTSPFFRMKGLLGRTRLNENEGIWLKPCAQIHMFFMKFPIDAIFLNRANEVVYIAHSIAPWKVSKWVRQAHSVLECAAGTAERAGLTEGNQLVFSESEGRHVSSG